MLAWGRTILACVLLASTPGFGQSQEPLERQMEKLPDLEIPDDLPAPILPPDPLIVPRSPKTGALQLTVQQAVELCWQDNPEGRAADSRVKQAYWSFHAAASPPSASVNLGTWQGNGQALLNGNYISENRADYYIQLVQPFWPLGSLKTSRRVAYKDYTVALANAKSVRVKLAQQVKDGFFLQVANQQRLQVAEQNLLFAESIYAIARTRFQDGAGPKIDLINAGIQRNRAEQDRILARAAFLQARDRLCPLLGVAAHTEVDCLGGLENPPLTLVYEVLADLARNNPRIRMAEETLERTRHATVLASQANNVTPTVSVAYDIVRPSYLVQMQLNIPLDWGRVRNDTRKHIEMEREQEAHLQVARLAVSSDLKAAFDNYQGAYLATSNYREKVLSPTEEMTRITQYGYTRGAIPYLQLLSTQQTLASVRRDYIDLQLSVQLALNALEAAVGRSLGSGPL